MMHKEKSEYRVWDSHRIKLADFYKKYPYKYYDITKNTVPMNPYIPKSEIVDDHKFSLTKNEWLVIVRAYLKYLKEYIISGHKFKIPHNLGYFYLVKYKSQSKVDWKATKAKGKLIFHKNSHTNDYTPATKWKRSNMPWVGYWKMEPSARFMRRLGEALRKNKALIYNYTT